MKNLSARAWFALIVLGVLMGLLLFVPAGTVHYWQAWTYLSIFMTASALTTLYLMRRDPALLERRMSGGPMAEKQPAQKFIMLCTSICFIAEVVDTQRVISTGPYAIVRHPMYHSKRALPFIVSVMANTV
jgi:protein-S-isoprenylcysteine O-methyltransferase Ste14